jgi:hypothetical protein
MEEGILAMNYKGLNEALEQDRDTYIIYVYNFHFFFQKHFEHLQRI